MPEHRRLPRNPAPSRLLKWLAAGLLVYLGGFTVAQAPWNSVSRDQFALGRGPLFFATAYDQARECVVLHDQNSQSTWEWRGAEWRRRGELLGGQELVFSAADARCLTMDDQALWAWDGVTWTRRGPSLGLPWVYASAGFAHDSRRDRLVVVSQAAGRSATFEFDGVSWREMQTVLQPPPSFYRTMVFDPVRDRSVLLTESGTWEWDGVAWLHRQPENPPVGRALYGMVFDARRGVVVAPMLDRVWEWDGVDWSSVPASGGPHGFPGSLAFDEARGEILAVVRNAATETWTWDGVHWSLRDRRPLELPNGLAMAADPSRQEVVAFGGLIDSAFPGGQYLDRTLRWDGNSWEPVDTILAPPPRASAAVFYDSRTQRITLFGGELGAHAYDDLWSWTGSDWSRVHTNTAPPARPDTGVAFDQGRGRAVLFGGGRRGQWFGRAGVWFGDTWEWDGTDWTERVVPHAPAARYGHAMAYDAARARVVLFGGEVATPGVPWTGTPSSETWEWDGADWRQLHPATRPAGGAGATMIFHPSLGRVVLRQNGIWSWDGRDWAQHLPATAVDRAVSRSLAVDPATGALLVPSVGTVGGLRYRTCLLGQVSSASSRESGPGCAGSSGTVPRLHAAQPWLGTSVDFELQDGTSASQAVLLFSRSTGTVLFAGCSLHVGSLEATVPLSLNRYGAGLHSISIPDLAALRGIALHGQALVLDTMSKRGFALSNAQRIVLGDGD